MKSNIAGTQKKDSPAHIFRQALILDIYDLNYFYISSALLRFKVNAIRALPRKGVFLHFLGYFFSWFKTIDIKKWKKERAIPKHSILFYSETITEKNALMPIHKIVKESVLFGSEAHVPFLRTFFSAYFYSLPYLFLLIKKLFLSRGLIKISYKYNFKKYWLTYGLYIAERLWLRKVDPRIIITSNDRSMENRVLCKAASDEHIKTMYIQHASIAEEFPALNFNFALLEGRDALEIYNKIGKSKTKVFLIGIPRFSLIGSSINQHEKVENLGYCTNANDPFEKVEENIVYIKKFFPNIGFFLRPHPADIKYSDWRLVANRHGLSFSDSRIINSLDFLKQVDCIIAGDSNILLEAANLNVYPLLFDYFNKPELIQYSFLRHGLCEYYSNSQDLVKRIEQLTIKKDLVRHKAIRYVDTIGTCYEFSSNILAKEMIMEIIEGKESSDKRWKRIKQSKIEAYSLRR